MTQSQNSKQLPAELGTSYALRFPSSAGAASTNNERARWLISRAAGAPFSPVVSTEEQAARQKREAARVYKCMACREQVPIGYKSPYLRLRLCPSCSEIGDSKPMVHDSPKEFILYLRNFKSPLADLPGPVIDGARGEHASYHDRHEVDRIRTYNHPRGFRDDRGV
jgi:DNA-directed RNA polymerase subunit RPC12/RpoP